MAGSWVPAVCSLAFTPSCSALWSATVQVPYHTAAEVEVVKMFAFFSLKVEALFVRSSAITARNACYLLNLGIIDENEVVYILLDFM